MTDNRKTSEDLIREARSRLGSGGAVPPPPEVQDDEATQRVIDDGHSRPHESERPSPPEMSHVVESPQVSTEAEVELVSAPGETSADETTASAPGPLETSPPRRALFTTRWFRLVILVAVGLGYGFFTSLDDANRDASGEIVSGGDLDVMTVQPGDCFNDPSDEEDVVFQLEAIPCSQPHDNEVFAVESVAGLFGSDYPGRQTLEEHAYEVCSGRAFDSYVGTPYLDSSLEVFTLTPTDDSWSEGDRDVVCVLYRLDFTKLTEPARNSGL